MKTSTALSVTSSQREQTSLDLKRRGCQVERFSTPDLENPSASVHRKRFSTPCLLLDSMRREVESANGDASKTVAGRMPEETPPQSCSRK